MKINKKDRLEKKCNVCKEIKELKEFNKSVISPDKHSYTCRYCMVNLRLKSRYNLTREEVDNLYITQEGKCCICNEFFLRKSLVVDHNHKTGITRGLLCSPCNRGIGLLKDDKEIILSAVKYLNKHT